MKRTIMLFFASVVMMAAVSCTSPKSGDEKATDSIPAASEPPPAPPAPDTTATQPDTTAAPADSIPAQ